MRRATSTVRPMRLTLLRMMRGVRTSVLDVGVEGVEGEDGGHLGP